VAIARALIAEPEVLLLDEPTSGLDPQAADELLTLLRRLADDGASVLMTTHDLTRVGAIADTVGFMRRGLLAHSRTRAELAGADLLALYLEHAGATKSL